MGIWKDTTRTFTLAVVLAVCGPGAATAAPCLTSDVSLKIGSTVYAPTSCADGVAQGGGPGAETASLDSKLGTTGFVYLDSSEDGGTPTGIGGVTFKVSATNGNSGDWTIEWTEQPGTPNLPLIIDFAVGLFGGNNGAGYRFDDVLLTVSPHSGTGTFDINFVNGGGQQPGLSHLILAGGNAESCTTDCVVSFSVPEPGTLALAGFALIAAGLARRLRRA